MAGSNQGISAPTMIVTGGALDGQSVVIAPGETTLLGSGRASVLELPFSNVAAEHARLEWVRLDVLLSDLDSPTGTYVNGERIDKEHPLADGDRVCLGPPGSKQSVKLLVRLPAAEAAPLSFGDTAPEGTLDLRSPAADLGLEAGPLATPAFDFGGSLESASDEPLVLLDPVTGAPTRPEAERITAAASEEQEGSLRADRPEAEATPTVPDPPQGRSPGTEETPATPEPVRPRTGTRPRLTPEYTNDMPSIMPERPREAPSVTAAAPPIKAPAPKRLPSSSSIRLGRFELPRLAVFAIGALVAGLVLVAGLRMAILPAPIIVDVSPDSVSPGATITIAGAGFSSSPTGNEVAFGDVKGLVKSATEQRLTVTVPQIDLAHGGKDVRLTVRANGKVSSAKVLRVYLVAGIRSVQPDVALPGSEVLLTLTGPPEGSPTVRVRGQLAELLQSDGAALKIRIPALDAPMGSTVPITLEGVGEPAGSAKLVIGKLPLLAEVAPDGGQAGTRVTLRGRGFSPDPARNVVRFGGYTVPVLRASANELVVSAPPPPASESQFPAAITVNVDGAASNSGTFAQARPSSSVFVPRFFVGLVPSAPERLYVSSELGPLILLGEKDDAPSIGERAALLVDALNAAVDAAQRGQPPTFEVRDNPRPGVGLTGSTVLVCVAPGDVAAYQGQAKGQQVSPRPLAAYWTALLQDYFALFTSYQRPSAVAELSPRGRVLIDVFADAQRRAAASGNSGGVPRSLLLPLSPALERDLRELALLLPTGAARAAVAGVAIEGAWTGSMEEAGVGTRAIQVTLRHEDGKLSGALSTRSRALAMGIPLTNVSWEKGSLRFTALIGGAPREFAGTLEGSTLSGKVQTPGGKTILGDFTLNFVK